MAVRRRIPKPVVAAAIRTAPRVAKTISRAARGAMPKGTSARVNPKLAKARAAQAKKADKTEGRRRAMAAVSKKRNPTDKYKTPREKDYQKTMSEYKKIYNKLGKGTERQQKKTENKMNKFMQRQERDPVIYRDPKKIKVRQKFMDSGR